MERTFTTAKASNNDSQSRQTATQAAFVDKRVQEDSWRLETIPADIVGLSRDIQVYRTERGSKLITYAKHGDKDTFCPPIW